MNEPVLLFCRQWALTAALAALLSPAYAVPVIPVYERALLVSLMELYRNSPLILGVSPHEHVTDLYRLQPLLSGRAVMFVAPRFYWTDHSLGVFLGLSRSRFCSPGRLWEPSTRRAEAEQFRRLSAEAHVEGYDGDVTPCLPGLTDEQIVTQVNVWLHRRMEEAGISREEIMTLLLLSGLRKGRMPVSVLSRYKIRGLCRLGMERHVINLYRGIIIRPELQVVLS
ncbi:hypothetical protein HF234_003736 [Salmonella enterica]|nr:hypothetical protein [Salmonella enterica]